MNVLLSLENVSHTYQKERVLNQLNFSLTQGEICAILGASGGGKTTLLRLIAGLEYLQEGRIIFEDKIIACSDKHTHILPEKRGMGMMFQNSALFPHLSVEKNIFFGLKRQQVARKKWASQMAHELGIGEHLKKYPSELSGGQQQRVSLLRALAPKPKLLLLDEAFSALDLELRKHIRSEVKQLIKDEGVSLIMVTHDADEAHFMADTVAVLQAGKLQTAPHHTPL